MKKFIPLVGVFLFIFALLTILTYRAFISSGEKVSISPCEKVGGQWSEEFRECSGIDIDKCQIINGIFNECASACRNTKQEICTMQCVQVCDVK